MNRSTFNRIVFYLSLALAALTFIAGVAGMLWPEKMYGRESVDWYAQSIGQDIVDLFLVLPVFIIASCLAWRQNRRALQVWAGVLIYLLYTFAIYCFDIHFNRLFVVYCFVLGLSIFLFAWFVLSQYKSTPTGLFMERSRKLTGIYMVVIACIFYLLWLAQIIPANLNDVPPKELADAGLFTNPVHVLDLSVFLPGIMITGILLLRNHSLGLLLTPVVLTFLILMSLTIAVLMIVMKRRGLDVDNTVGVVMFILALISSVLLVLCLKSGKN